jgi:adenylosuccinate synthase
LEIVVGYELDGALISEMPSNMDDLARVTCRTETLSGFPALPLSEWLDLARKANADGAGFTALPTGAREYVEKVEAWLGIRIHSVGVGPDREVTVYRA